MEQNGQFCHVFAFPLLLLFQCIENSVKRQDFNPLSNRFNNNNLKGMVVKLKEWS